MIKNIEDLLEQCDEIFSIFSLHNWHYPFILDREDNGNKILTFISDIRYLCEKYENGLIFSSKEIEILKSTNDNYLLLDVLKDYLNDKKYCNNYDVKMFDKLNQTELIEFKSKLEKLI